MEEVWKDIPGYEGLYQVSSFGNVKSLGRYGKNRYKPIWRPGKVLSAGKDNKGYLTVVLSKNSKRHTYKVHRLVALTFIPKEDGKPQINHIDGNKSNNNINNLEWCSQSENMLHAWETGLQKRMHKKNDLRSISIVQYNSDMQLVNTYPSMMEAERKTGISSASISRSVRQGYKAGGFVWKYA